ncbi:MAG TPA: fimbria/pilus outer membrane usher protein [Pseudolabrys sp.]|nr:fimbria/pilus outer membrane usher protein [Pseudolabrys sp.]
MRSPLRKLFARSRDAGTAFLLAALLAFHHGVRAAEESRQLQLEVYINGESTRLIGSFIQLADKRMAARRGELTDMGIKPPGSGANDELVIIDGLADVSYRYDEPGQKIFFKLGDDRRVTKQFDARGRPHGLSTAPSAIGAVLNYTAFASSTKEFDGSSLAFSGANATLDGRLFGPYGTLSQSGIIGTTATEKEVDALRLDTTWTYSTPQSLLTYRAGDLISGGLLWTRPIRLGGVQVQRNFSLRPDLVTFPLPSVSGSAAVPSTVDVYVNNVKTHSQQVPAGPYQINNVPTLTGGGIARVVVRDAAGRAVETSLPFYISPKLLKENFVDFSIEAGAPRIFYGTPSSSYLEDPVGSASLRGGVYDWLTLEAHVEMRSKFVNGGLGAALGGGSMGVLSFAGSASQFGNNSGFQSYAAYDTQIGVVSVHASALQTFRAYNDLASVTATSFVPPFSDVTLSNVRPAKSLDAVSVGVPLPFDKSGVNVGFVHQVLDDNTRSDLVNVTYSRALSDNATLSLTAFSDIYDRRNYGVFFGLSMRLGTPESATYASVSTATTHTGTNVTTDVAKSMQPVPGSYGWHLRDSEGTQPYRSASGSYRSSVAQFDAYVQQAGRNAGGSIQMQGAVAAMDGGVFFSNRIDDAFAVVDADAPNIDVFYENRPAGTTDRRGQLLIPSLRSYQKNKISIDPRGLPIDADAPTTQDVVAPADRSGVIVDFGVKTNVSAAVVILTGSDGKFVAVGSHGKLKGTREKFVVGYDGRAYLRGLAAENTVVVSGDTGECQASFPFTPKKNTQVVIGPVVCR